MRHTGQLKDDYLRQLSGMTLTEICQEAARHRSDFRRAGTATALILRWAIAERVGHSTQATNYFMSLYRQAWTAEKLARAEGRSTRPTNRPAMGPSRYRHKPASLAPSYC